MRRKEIRQKIERKKGRRGKEEGGERTIYTKHLLLQNGKSHL